MRYVLAMIAFLAYTQLSYAMEFKVFGKQINPPKPTIKIEPKVEAKPYYLDYETAHQNAKRKSVQLWIARKVTDEFAAKWYAIAKEQGVVFCRVKDDDDRFVEGLTYYPALLPQSFPIINQSNCGPGG